MIGTDSGNRTISEVSENTRWQNNKFWDNLEIVDYKFVLLKQGHTSTIVSPFETLRRAYQSVKVMP
jgi:hypothetical protein